MGFNLRGGRPKNMKQGIYWVQRHLADQKRVAAEERKIQKDRQRIAFIDEKFNRIKNNISTYFISIKGSDGKISIETNERNGEKLSNLFENYNSLMEYIEKDKYGLKLTAFTKLATNAKILVKFTSKLRGDKVSISDDKKILHVNGLNLDFS